MPARASRSVVYRLIRAVLIVVGLILLAPYALTPLYHFVNPVSTLMLWRKAMGARVERTWVPLTAIAPALPRTEIASEDA
ncbi:MAG: monofunctional biosynthetic peptidoglycan transglycosylase, partial [Xanthobacteraceae bacterium]